MGTVVSERAIAREELVSTGHLVEDQSPVLAPARVMLAVPATYVAAPVAYAAAPTMAYAAAPAVTYAAARTTTYAAAPSATYAAVPMSYGAQYSQAPVETIRMM